MSGALIYAVEIEGYDPDLPGVRTLYFASNELVTGAADTPAHTPFQARVRSPAWATRECFGDGATGERASVVVNELELINMDGALDHLLEWGFAGRPVTVRVGAPGAVYPGGFSTVLTGSVDQPVGDELRMLFRFRDKAALLENPVNANRYLGNNTGADGVEGTTQDLLGRVKPRLFGKCFRFEPVLVNASKLVYQCADNAIHNLFVYDKGVLLTAGTAYASQADMMATAPAAGQMRAWLAGGMFRLGSSPAGLVQATTQVSGSAPDWWAATVMREIALAAGIPSGDIVAADVTALNAVAPYQVGIYLRDEMPAARALDQIADSIGAWWSFDAVGQLRMGQITAPAGTPALEIGAHRIIGSPQRRPSPQQGKGVPVWRVKLGYNRIWRTWTDADVAGSVSTQERAWYSEPERYVIADDASVKTAHPLATEMQVSTLLLAYADAQAEVARLLAMYKALRATYDVTVAMDAATAQALALGSTVRITYPRFGMSGGKLMRVIRMRPDLRAGQVELSLWG